MTKTRWSKKQNRRLRELYHAGCSDEEIVQRLDEEGVRTGLSVKALQLHRNRMGLKRQGPKKRPPRNVPLAAAVNVPPDAETARKIQAVPVQRFRSTAKPSTNGRVPVRIGKLDFTTDTDTAKAMIDLLIEGAVG